ncbi:unnamed protein product [Candidula unifasciata]|uniref:Trimeric intracellular cation channel type B n=1 Tax=Candidula unifasciata TaxID=100452 RepID=A0A8S3ZI21_9EUPU|nr:unnamed protein product [Candidula unifasciata]
MAANISSLEEQVFEFAAFMKNVDMFPVFFTAHVSLACLVVREDSKDLGTKFRQNHPFTLWLCTVIASVSGVFLANFLFGDPLVDILKENKLIAFITILWYLINYCPFDVVYKVVALRPVFLTAAILQECLRLRFIYLGVQQAAKLYPTGYVIIIIGGVIKGNGYGFVKIVERLIRGKWIPTTNDLLDITYFAKSSLYASVLFLLQHMEVLAVPVELLYLGIVVAFVTLRLIIVLGGVRDPLLPIELPICTLLFGSGAEDKDTGKTDGVVKKEKVIKNGNDREKQDKKIK